ncbi:hypothetical protein BB560_006270, partial [Smittium megazygosporum]
MSNNEDIVLVEWRDHVGVPRDLVPLLQTNPMQGLTSLDAEIRMAKFGKNEIVEKKRNGFLHFLSFFTGSIAYLIIFAMVLTGIAKDWINFGIIGALLFLNAFIGWFENSKAESAVDSLKSTLAMKSKVVRGGKIESIDSTELVPGDIVILRIGDIVPADALLLGITADGNPSQVDLLIDQSSLTGESLPVARTGNEMVYASSTIKQGQMLAVVVNTGVNTFIGKAAQLISISNEQGNFQRVVNQIGNFLVFTTLIMVVIIFFVIYVRRKKSGTRRNDESVMLSALQDVVVLAVAAIPVGLPTVLSVTMAVGSKMLAKKSVILKRLTAVEELSSINYLCCDKTGTLTLNKLSIDKPYLSPGYTEEDLLL